MINSLAAYARTNEYGFLESPFRKAENGKVIDSFHYLSAIEEGDYVIAQASALLDSSNKFTEELVPVRYKNEFSFMPPERVDFMDIFILWRGKFEAFKNELRTRKKEHKLIIKTIIDGRGGYEWKLDEEDRLPHRTDAYKCNEVRAWLLTKGINTNIENIELTMPPQYLPSVQGDSVSIFNSINKRGKKVVKTIEDAFAEAVEKEHEEDFRRLLKESKKILEKINKSEKKRKS